MSRIFFFHVVCFSVFSVSSVFANPAGVIMSGNLKINGAGNGLVFPDGSIQYQATVQGPAGPQGPAGQTGPRGPSVSRMVPDDYATIQLALNSLPSEGGSVFIRAGVYVITQSIQVDRSNVSISGEPGTILKLGNGVNQPVFSLGSIAEVPVTTISNIWIQNLEIDGNKEFQTSEIDPTKTWIRNNGIDVRAVNGLWINGVNIHNARSGGLVISWGSSNVFVTNSIFNNNYFDGIALYDSKDIQITNFQCMKNGAAGLSLDNNLSDVQFVTGRIESNLDVGIFARSSKDLSFNNLVIAKNKNHGCFLSHQQTGNDSGVTRLFFAGCSFLNNTGYGLFLASTSTDSPQNIVSGSLFSGNTIAAVNLDPNATLTQVGNITQ